MTVRGTIERALNYSPMVASAIYGAVVVVLLATTWLALAGIYSGASALGETEDLLARLQNRKAGTVADGGTMTGSPFLEGPSVTTAGAALLQRVGSAVTKAGGLGGITLTWVASRLFGVAQMPGVLPIAGAAALLAAAAILASLLPACP